MFKRRSSKDLSAKIGYDHVNGKASSKNPSASTAMSASVAPVANIVPGHQKQSSFSSALSYRKTTGMPSPEGDSGGATDTTSTSTGPSPLAVVKPLPPSAQQAVQQRTVPANGAATASSSSVKAPSKSKAAAPKAVVAEPPSKSLVIGEGVLFEGTTEGCAAAVVGGRLVGTVKSRRLEITRAGRMEGTAYTETAEIAGTFEGNLTVTKALKVCDV